MSGEPRNGPEDSACPDLAQALFPMRLVAWQARCGRYGLPWQQTRDPYRIWLSEIMLQQTQVSTVLPYYRRFLERFPRLEVLAAAPLDEVLELWAGLGYYARARHLHRCAQALVAEYGGRFPEAPAQIATLPGIGRSTAAAIAVFAFGVRAAILDGNVKRVLARCFGLEGRPGVAATEKPLWALADSLLPEKAIEAYTQGLMDLGATLCTRARPRCGACPMAGFCVAQRDGRQAELPVARTKKSAPVRKTTMLLLVDGDGRKVLLERRPSLGLWGGLLVLPELACETSSIAESTESAEEFAGRHGCRVRETRALPSLSHAFSHFRLVIHPLLCRVEKTVSRLAEPGWEWLLLSEAGQAALPAPIRRLIESVREE